MGIDDDALEQVLQRIKNTGAPFFSTKLPGAYFALLDFESRQRADRPSTPPSDSAAVLASNHLGLSTGVKLNDTITSSESTSDGLLHSHRPADWSYTTFGTIFSVSFPGQAYLHKLRTRSSTFLLPGKANQLRHDG